LLLERDQTGLAGQHLDGDAQNTRQQFLQVEFLGDGTGDFEQVSQRWRTRKSGSISTDFITDSRMGTDFKTGKTDRLFYHRRCGGV